MHSVHPPAPAPAPFPPAPSNSSSPFPPVPASSSSPTASSAPPPQPPPPTYPSINYASTSSAPFQGGGGGFPGYPQHQHPPGGPHLSQAQPPHHQALHQQQHQPHHQLQHQHQHQQHQSQPQPQPQHQLQHLHQHQTQHLQQHPPHQQQPPHPGFHPRAGSSSFHPTQPRFPDPNFQYQGMYSQQPYHMGGYQMGVPGPGPGTMQNAYGGYQGDVPPRQSYGFGGYEGGIDGQRPSTSATDSTHPDRPPFPADGYDQFANGPGHPGYQSYYPPGHPYGYGGGVGYSPYPPNPVQYGYGYDGYVPPLPPPPIPPQPSKGLNPAAQGFNYVPPTRIVTGNGDTPVSSIPNGDASASSIGQAPATFAPVVVDGEKLKGIGGRRISETEGALGLTVEDEPAQPNLSASITTVSTSTPAMTPSPTASTSPTSVQTPRVTETETPSPKAAAGEWNFVGPTVPGYTSPTAASATRSFSQAMSTTIRSVSSSTTASASASRKAVVAAIDGPIKLVSVRPDAAAAGDNSYASTLAKAVPENVKTKVVASEGQTRWTTKGQAKASKKRAVFASNDSKARPAPTLVFGTIAEEPQSAPAPVPGPGPAPAPSAAAPATPATPSSIPIPKPKPSSWAALLQKPSSSTTPSASAAPSKRASPSRSTISLGPETPSEAGPSRLPPSTPKSGTPATLPPSTGASVSAAPRPAFNYAAAAAAGAALSPQDELVRLLSEGIKGKAREGANTLPRGLINTGNMCFANTILQVLVYCPPFTELFEELGKRLKADLARKTPLLEAMIIFLREFIPTTGYPSAAPSVSGTSTPRSEQSLPNGASTPRGPKRDPRREAFVPENVYDAMKENKRFDSMRRGFQEDAEEYLGFFLNTLHEELLYLLSRTHIRNGPTKSQANGDDASVIERPVSPGAGGEDGWLEVGKKQKTNVVRSAEVRETAVSRIFGGTLRSVLHTPGQKDSVTLEPYQPLQLDISDARDITDALRHISQPEVVPVWSASRKENVDATKTVFIESFPAVLILHLKRFVYDPLEQSVVKKGKAVGYGTELVVPPEIISPARRSAGGIKYKLFGVVYHHGMTATGGHYTVAVSRQDGGGWVHFDDEAVQPVPKEDVVVSSEEAESGRAGLVGGREKCAYLLFYQRVRA